MHGYAVSCVDVSRCTMWRKLLFQFRTKEKFEQEALFIQKGQTLKIFMLVLGPLSLYDDSWKKETFDA